MATAGLAAGASLLAVGCGSSDSSSSKSGPIKIMATGVFDSPALGFGYPETLASVQAHAKAINAEGGINGRKIAIIACNDQGDPNVAASCARKAVSEKVSAVIAGFSLFADSLTPVLQAANIPFIGNAALSPTDGTSPISFPMDGGSPITAIAIATALINSGCKDAGVLSQAFPSAAVVVTYFTKTFEAAGGTVVKAQVPVTGATSYAPQVSTLVGKGAKCMASVQTPPEFNKFLVSVRQTGKDIVVATGAATGLASVEGGGAPTSDTNGLLLVNATNLPVDTTAPGVKQITEEMAKYTPKSKVNQEVLPTFAGFQVLAEALKKANSTDPKDVLASLNKIRNFDTGLTPPISTKPLDVKGFERLFNTSNLTYKVQDGKLARTGDFTDFADKLKSYAP